MSHVYGDKYKIYTMTKSQLGKAEKLRSYCNQTCLYEKLKILNNMKRAHT